MTILGNDSSRARGPYTKVVHKTAQGLKALIRLVERASRQLHGQVETIQDSSNLIAQQVEGVTHTIREITAGIQDSAEHIQDAAAQMQHIQGLLEQIRRDNGAVVAASGEVSAAVGEGKREIADAAAQMRRMTTESAQLHEEMAQLKQALAQIVDITRIVEQVSGLTQLLALNANIEAARAGEHGKGFAVVAQEISRLAQQSKQATGLVGEHVRTVSASAQTLASSIEAMKQTADAGAFVMDAGFERYEQVESFLAGLCGSIETVDESLLGVTGSVHAISDVVHRTSAMFEQVAAGSEEVLASAEMQQRGIVQMNAGIREAGRSSLTLRSAVSQFKLPEAAKTHPLHEAIDGWMERAIGIRAVMVSMIEAREAGRIRYWHEEKTLAEAELSKAFARLGELCRLPGDQERLAELQAAWESFAEAKERNARWMLDGEYEKARQGLVNIGRARFKRALDLAQGWLDG
uniref:Methyl-accepting transducer domain-containing protein n=1 Tax=Paenibacillus athensensis TaxID=1967502 RepID=A0A4Y8PSY2_9BACL